MRVLMASIAVAAGVLQSSGAQTATVDHLSQSEILERAQALEGKAKDGAAAVKLNEYPNHYTMISLRQKNGGAEVHENYSDLFFVVKGKATLLSGGDVQEAKSASPGEIRGTAIKNGSATVLKEGDFIHIPAGVSHQLLIADGDTFIYFVVKVKEK